MTTATATETATINELAGSIYDLLAETFTLTVDDYNSNEWQKETNGGFSVVEVYINKTSIEVLRGEFNKNETQLGAKATVDVHTRADIAKVAAIVSK